MLGSVHDADDALQDTLLGAWRGISGFQQRSSLRSWLFRIATNDCLRLAERRPRRILSIDYGPDQTDVYDLGEPVHEPIWLEPYPAWPARVDTNPESRYEQRENVELAFVRTLQHVPARQRAVLNTYSAYARGTDVLWGMWQWLDRVPVGRNEGDMSWFRRHDEYGANIPG